MFWRQSVQNIGLSNYKLKSALKCTVVTTHARPRQTDEDHDNSATICSTNASRAKTSLLLNGPPNSCHRQSNKSVDKHIVTDLYVYVVKTGDTDYNIVLCCFLSASS